MKIVSAIAIVLLTSAAMADERPAPLYRDQTELTYAEAVRCSENPWKIPEAQLPLEKLVGPHQQQRCAEEQERATEHMMEVTQPRSVLVPPSEGN
jgi:hypothetical protein